MCAWHHIMDNHLKNELLTLILQLDDIGCINVLLMVYMSAWSNGTGYNENLPINYCCPWTSIN